MVFPRIRTAAFQHPDSRFPKRRTALFSARKIHSPHTRGCFLREILAVGTVRVFPAYAGVFPESLTRSQPSGGLPRIRGGVSIRQTGCQEVGKSSPHTRGCFQMAGLRHSGVCVFPAYAGVFPLFRPDETVWYCLPRIRGGVSRKPAFPEDSVLSSPHTRGCFLAQLPLKRAVEVFPAYAGVFPKGLPILLA